MKSQGFDFKRLKFPRGVRIKQWLNKIGKTLRRQELRLTAGVEKDGLFHKPCPPSPGIAAMVCVGGLARHLKVLQCRSGSHTTGSRGLPPAVDIGKGARHPGSGDGSGHDLQTIPGTATCETMCIAMSSKIAARVAISRRDHRTRTGSGGGLVLQNPSLAPGEDFSKSRRSVPIPPAGTGTACRLSASPGAVDGSGNAADDASSPAPAWRYRHSRRPLGE